GLLSSADTLQRTTVLASSNSNTAVDWPAGDKTVRCAINAALAMSVGRLRTAAETSGGIPTMNDDASKGYTVGSIWNNNSALNRQLWICVDATVGAASWYPLLGPMVWSSAPLGSPPSLGSPEAGLFAIGF